MNKILSSLLLVSALSFAAATRADVADAAMHGDMDAVRKLIAQKADVNTPQADGATALHWAVFKSNKPLVDLLLKSGANAKNASS